MVSVFQSISNAQNKFSASDRFVYTMTMSFVRISIFRINDRGQSHSRILHVFLLIFNAKYKVFFFRYHGLFTLHSFYLTLGILCRFSSYEIHFDIVSKEKFL